MSVKQVLKRLYYFIKPKKDSYKNGKLCGVSLNLLHGTLREKADQDDAWWFYLSKHHNTIFDVGANIGYTALLALIQNPKRQIILVDPNPKALQMAAMNIIQNSLGSRAQYLTAFVGDKLDDTVKFYTVGAGAAGSMYASHAETASSINSFLEVKTVTLDYIYEFYQIKPGLVKIDVEGAETLVMKSAKKLAAETHCTFFIEMHNVENLGMEAAGNLMIDWCREQHYEAWYLKTGELLLSGQTIAGRGKCHLLLIPKGQAYPEYLKGVNQNSALPKINLMLFSFLKYLQPTHYFQRYTKAGASIFPEAKLLPPNVITQLQPDNQYRSSTAKAYDLSWQAIQLGYIGDVATYKAFESVPLQDDYRFIRKNFHQAWVFFVLLLRVLSFHNPFKEISAWFNTRAVQQHKALETAIIHKEWTSYTSQLVEDRSLVSVIIPTLNRYHYLNDVLKDLEHQDYTNFEVIVVDQSDDFNVAFYDDFNLNFNIIKQSEKALWLARNNAIKASKGELIALSEDDVRIQPDWISMHLKCLDFFNAKVSAGVFYPEGQQIPKSRSFFAVGSQFATGNAMLHKSVFKTVGLFDRQFEKQRMGDGEFGMRLYLEGIKSISNPLASCIDVKAGTGGLREMGSWDSFRPSKFFAPRPIPSVLYYFRSYFGNKAARLAMLRMIPLSLFSYQFKKNKPMLVLGVFEYFAPADGGFSGFYELEISE